MKTYSEQEIKELEEDLPEDIICPYCKNRGYRVLLGGKILMPGEPRTEDYENWLECPRCYQVIPIYEGLKEETVADKIETVEGPFDDKTKFESVHKKLTSITGRKIVPRGRKRKRVLHDDPEIDALMRICGDHLTVQ